MYVQVHPLHFASKHFLSILPVFYLFSNQHLSFHYSPILFSFSSTYSHLTSQSQLLFLILMYSGSHSAK